MTSPPFPTADIRHYYDRHTRAFVRFGQGGGAIHRAVCMPGRTREQAFHYVEDRIAELIVRLKPDTTTATPKPDSTTATPEPGVETATPKLSPPRLPAPVNGQTADVHVLDLGCGVGASLCYLAKRVPIRGTGVTLSPVQARLAQQRIAAEALSDRVRVLEGDFAMLPDAVDRAHVAYAIESFVHAPAPERFFAEAARVIVPGGLLVICDDVRRETSDPAAPRMIEQFRHGWHVNTLLTADQLRAMAAAAGFEHVSTEDLTPALDIGRARDRFIDLLAVSCGWLPFVWRRADYLLGGSALQRGLARGWIAYELAVFRRVNVATTGL